jgi:hypothetical protein
MSHFPLPDARGAANSAYSNDLIGAGEQRWRHRNSEWFRDLEVDYRFVFGQRLHGQVSSNTVPNGA